MNSQSPKSNMLTRFKKKFLPKNRKYEIASGCPDHSATIDDVTLNRYEVRSKSGSLGSNASGSPKHQHTGVIWHNNTYDILPYQVDTISPKKSLRQNSLPSRRRQGGEDLPPLPLKAREAGDLKKKYCDHDILLADSCKTPSPTDSVYVTPRPIIQQIKDCPVEVAPAAAPATEEETTLDIHKEEEDELLPPPNFRDCDEQTEEDKEFPATWLRSPRIKSPNASVSTPSPTDSLPTDSESKVEGLTSDSNAEKRPSLKKREKQTGGVKPPMMRPLRKKKAPVAGPGDKRDSKNLDKEDSPLPPPPPPRRDEKSGDRLSQCSSTADSNGGGQRDSGLSSAGSMFEGGNDSKNGQAVKTADQTGYTSFDELQNHLRMTALPAPPVVEDSEVVDNDAPFPPPPPPLSEVFVSPPSRHLKVEEGEPLKQTIVRPRYKDELLGYDVGGGGSGGRSAMSSDDVDGVQHLQEPSQSQNVQRNISHESGYETAGIDHSSSFEQIRCDDVFPDPVQDLITENLDYGDEVELRKGPIFRETTEVSLLSSKAVRDMYAFVPKTGVSRSESNHTDTSTDNYPESPENTGTSTSVSSPEDDGDRDTLKMSTELLLPATPQHSVVENGGEAVLLEEEDDDYLPPIPTRNYQPDSDSNKTVHEEDEIVPCPLPLLDHDDLMISSMNSDMSMESMCASEPVHMSLDEVREQAKTLGVPLSITNSTINQSQPCITSKTRSMSETSTEAGPASPTSKHNTFPIDKSSTPTGTPKKHGTKKKPKLRIPNIFHRGKSSPEPPPLRCELHDTIQKRSLPAPPPRGGSEEDNDKTPVGSPAHQRSVSSSALPMQVSSTCQIHGTLGARGSTSGSGYPRSMPGREWSTTPRPASRTNTPGSNSDSPSHSTLSLASTHAHSLAASVTSVNSAVSSSGYATNSTSLSMHTNSNADFISSLSKLKHVGWYWGPLSWDEAESKIANKPDGSFLVRDSSDDRYILSLSFRSQNLTHHTRIEHYKGMFSFYSQPKSHGAATIIDFIEKAMEHSRNGKFLYFLRPRAPGLPPAPVQLLFPISRFRTLQSLQHICRFEIIKHVRKDHIHQLPIPHKIKDYLLSSQYYIEEYS